MVYVYYGVTTLVEIPEPGVVLEKSIYNNYSVTERYVGLPTCVCIHSCSSLSILSGFTSVHVHGAGGRSASMGYRCHCPPTAQSQVAVWIGWVLRSSR